MELVLNHSAHYHTGGCQRPISIGGMRRTVNLNHQLLGPNSVPSCISVLKIEISPISLSLPVTVIHRSSSPFLFLKIKLHLTITRFLIDVHILWSQLRELRQWLSLACYLLYFINSKMHIFFTFQHLCNVEDSYTSYLVVL